MVDVLSTRIVYLTAPEIQHGRLSPGFIQAHQSHRSGEHYALMVVVALLVLGPMVERVKG